MKLKVTLLFLLFCAAISMIYAQTTTLSVDTQIAAANVTQGTVKHALYHFHLQRSATGTVNLTDVNFTTAGTYQATDVVKFQLWYNTTDALGSATQLSSDITSGLGTGSHSFATFSQLLATSSTRYFWITADIDIAAVTTRTINVAAWTTTNFTVSSGTKSGSASAGGTQTITAFASLSSDYFRSNATGTWSTAGNWQSSHDNVNWATATSAPSSSANTITIRDGNTISVGGAVSIDQTVVDLGGQLNVSGGITLTVANGTGTDLTVNGTLRNNAGTITTTGTVAFGSTGLYQHNFTTTAGTIPIATWDIASTCEIMGYTTNTTAPTNMDQTFGNFTFNCTNLTANFNAAGNLTTVDGNLSVTSTGTGTFRLKGNGGVTLNIGGDLIITDGTLNTSSGTNTMTINLSGNFTMSGGTLTESGGGTNNLNFDGTTAQIISITNSPTISNTINFAVNSAAIAEFEDDTTILGGSNGTFNVNSGGTLIIKHADGITSSGTTGCIQTTGTRTFSTGASYIYRSTVAQVQGNGLPTTVNNLTIDNAAGVTISANHTVTTLCSVTTGSTLNVGTYVIGGGTFTLNSGATLITANTAGITATGGGATGSVQATTRNFNTAANYTYNGASAQVSGTGFPNLCTGVLKVNTSAGINFSLSAARTMSTGGIVYLETGIFAAGTNLTLGTGSSITRNNGTMTGTIQGSNAYAVRYIGTGKTTGNELSGSGLGNITLNFDSSQTLTLDRSITVDNGETLTFTQGSLTLGNYNIIMNGNYTANNLFIYNGTGALGGGNLSNLANVLVTVTSPTAVPSVVNEFNVSPGVGNTLTLPGDFTTSILTFTNGDLGFNGHTVTLADKDFAFTGTNTMSALSVTLDPTAHTYNGYTSIAHTWQTNGTFTGTLDVTFLYPTALSSSPIMTLVNRDHIVGESIWDWVAMLSSGVAGSYHYVVLPGVTTLNGSTKGDLDWTLTETDQELPVELSSFTATLSQGTYVTVQWVTQSETNEIGFNVFRNNVNDLSSAVQVNANIIGATNSSVEHTYFFRDVIVTNDDAYYYWLQDITNSGIITYHGPVMVDLTNGGGITPPLTIPPVTSVSRIYPNPFMPSTMINYGVAKDGMVNLRIYNNRGQLVRVLVSEEKVANNYRVQWDGNDMNGRPCASGVYIVELKSGSIKAHAKAILMK